MPKQSSQKSGKILRRAIAKSDPTKERPTVGKPVIIDPPNRSGTRAKKRSHQRRSSAQEG
jgi:hypothetical protein